MTCSKCGTFLAPDMRFCSKCGATQGDVTSTLEVTPGFFPLAFFFFFCAPVIEIDGKAAQVRWGTHRYSVTPGRHQVRVWVPYLFWSRCGENAVEVSVDTTKPTHVSWYMPPLVFLKGSMRVY